MTRTRSLTPRLAGALLISWGLVACDSGEPAATAPAPAHSLLDAAEGLASEAGDVVFADDLADFDGATAPDGWQLFERRDLAGPTGEPRVTLVRAIETLHGDIDFAARVAAGPVGIRVARLPESSGPIPTGDPAELRTWLQGNSRTGDAREVEVAVGDEDRLEAQLTWHEQWQEPLSSRVIVSFDLVPGASAVGSVELARRPSFEVQYKSAVYGAPDFTGGAVRGRVNLGGDHRDALVVPAGTAIEMPLDGDGHLDGRNLLELGLGALAGSEPAQLVPVSGRLELLSAGEPVWSEPLHLDPARVAADRSWHDLRFDLSAVELAPGQRLRLSVDTPTGLAPDRPLPPALALAHPRLVGGTTDRPRPNLILVSLDTLRGDRVGPGADGRSLTPHLDAFAQDALVFTKATSAAPFTLPSHGTVFTGLLPTAHGGVDVSTPMRTGAASLTELLSLAGWTTTAFTGGGFMSPDFGFARGFERYTIHDPLITTETLPSVDDLGLDLSDAGALARADWENYLRLEAAWRLKRPAVEAWLEQAAAEPAAPFFLFLHTYAAHQYHPPKEIYDAEMAGTRSTWTFGRQLPTLSPEAFAANPPSPADQEHLRLLYDACVLHADEEFGAVLGELERNGLLEDSYVVVFSDHGEELFEHGDFGHSNSLRESLLHVPLMVAGPGITPGTVDRPVSLLDLPPTLCALLDLPVPETFQGVSLLRPVGATDFEPEPETSPVFAEVSHHAFYRDALRLEDWKVVRDYRPGGAEGVEPQERLHDLATGGEAVDLAGEHPDRVAQLLRLLEERRAAAEAAAADLPEDRGAVSDATKDQLGDLGYL